MTVLLKSGQSVHAEADLAMVDWAATGPAGHVEVVVQAETGTKEPRWQRLTPGKLVVPSLDQPALLVARPASGDLFEPGTTVRLQVTLRASSGARQELRLDGVDVSAGRQQVLLRLAPAGGGHWEVSRGASHRDVELPPDVLQAYYAARRALGDAAEQDLRPMVAVDASASMTAALRSGLVEQVLAVVGGVCARACGVDTPISVTAFGAAVDRIESALQPSQTPAAASRIASLVPRSGAAIGPVLDAASSAGHRRVVVVTDGAPADLGALDPEGWPHGAPWVCLIVLGESRWAALADDRVSSKQPWRHELTVLDRLVRPAALMVVSVPYRESLDSRTAVALAERLSLGLVA
jgi:hypothetical protein